MKKTLLLQTALVATAGLFLADIAAAQTKEVPIALTVGGYFSEVFKAADLDNSRTLNGRQSHGFATDAEIYFNIRGVLADGTVIGGRVELEGVTEGDQIDEAYMFVERSDIGRAEIGSTDRAASKMVFGAPTAIPGYGTIDPTGAIAVTNAPTGARTSGNFTKFAGAIDDANGINLYTSADRYFGSKAGKGLQLGVSYTPDGCQDFTSTNNTAVASAATQIGCGSGFTTRNDAGQVSRAYTYAANYLESFGAFDVGVFGAYNHFDIEANNAGSLANGSATVLKSEGLAGWAVGTTVTYNIGDGSSVQVGGAWKKEEMGVGPNDERNVYTAGARYLTNGTNPGSIGVGVDYAKTKADQGNIAGNAVSGEDEYTWISLGVTYQVARGILGFGGVGQYEYEDAIAAGTVVGGTAQADNNAKANFAIVGVRMDF
jgi:outer membrane protein OmpU